MSSVSLRCRKCGHSWKARSGTPKSPQCSKCRSRHIEIVETTPPTTKKESAEAAPSSSKSEDVDQVLHRFISDYKALIHHLRGVDVIDDKTFYSQIITVCPYCGAAREKGMHNKEGKLVCRNCGSTV